jgi:hypothetical protein
MGQVLQNQHLNLIIIVQISDEKTKFLAQKILQQEVLECTSKMLTSDEHYRSTKFILSIPSPIFL